MSNTYRIKLLVDPLLTYAIAHPAQNAIRQSSHGVSAR